MKPSRPTFAALAGAAALALAACGGGDSDEDQIRDIVDEINDDPASLCTDHGTDELVQGLGGEEQCKRLAAQEEDDPSEVQDVSVDGDTATVTVKDSDDTSRVTFVKQDGDWKVARSS